MIGGVTGHPGTETLHLVVDASPLVMAVWSLSRAISGHPRLAPHGASGNTKTQDRNTGPGGEATHMSARTPEAEPLLTPAEISTMFRVRPKTVTRWAKPQATDVNPHTQETPAIYEKTRFVHCSRVSGRSAPSDLLPSSPAGRPSGTAQGECGSARSMGNGGGPRWRSAAPRGCPAGKSPARHIPEGALPGPVRSQGEDRTMREPELAVCAQRAAARR